MLVNKQSLICESGFIYHQNLFQRTVEMPFMFDIWAKYPFNGMVPN